jgi:hypothetical protein
MTNDFICYPPKGVLVRTPQPDSGRRERYGITYRAVELAEETPTARMKIIGPLAFPPLVRGIVLERPNLFCSFIRIFIPFLLERCQGLNRSLRV